MPTVVAMPDAFASYNGQSLYQPNWQGVLTNDSSDPNTSLSVTAVNGQSANVGTSVVLASGSSVLLYGDGSFVYTPAVDFYGLDSFEYTASDGVYSDTTTVEISSIEIAIAPIANQSHIESDAVSLQVSASASSGPALSFTYSAYNLPTGLSIDADTGLISGTINYGAVGTWPVTVFAHPQNGSPAVGQFTFTWSVAPVEITIAEIVNQSHIESDSVSVQVTASVSHGPAIDYTFSAYNLPTGLSIDADTGLISGTINYGAVGSWPVTVFAHPQNGSPAVGQFTFTWSVAPVEITIAEIVDQSDVEGESVSLQVAASVSHGPTIDYTFSAYNLPSGLSIDADTGLISGAINYGAVGTWPVTVFAHPQNGSPAVGHFTFMWSVAPVEITVAVIANQESIEGDSVSLPVFASVSHGPAIDFSYVAVNLPPGLTIDSDTGLISGDLAYGTVGSWTVSLYAYPNNGSPAVGYSEVTWNIAPRSVVAAIAPIAAQNHREGDSVSLSVHATNSGSESWAFRATDLPEGLAIDPLTGVISGVLAPGTADDYTVHVYLESGTTEVTQSFTWSVAERITVAAIADQWNLDNEEVSLAIAAQSPDNATLTFSATGLPDGLTIHPETGIISGTILPEAGETEFFLVIVSATDGTYTGSNYFFWTVEAERFGDTEPAFTGPLTWEDPASPFHARDLIRAKYRAWNIASTGTQSSDPIGAEVAGTFGSDPALPWEAFFTQAEFEQLHGERSQLAQSLSPIVLRDLDAVWQEANILGPTSRFASIGEVVASAWQERLGFTWVTAGTSWEELYSLAAQARYAELRQVPIPSLTFSDGYQFVLDHPAILARHYLDNPDVNQVHWGQDLRTQFQTQVLPRLLYATDQELANHLRTVGERQRAMLRLGLTEELVRLQTYVSNPTPWSPGVLSEAQETFAFCQVLYAELNHLDAAADYGLHSQTSPTLENVLADIRAGIAGDFTYTASLLQMSRGTVLQRAAFLAATDYQTYLAHEPQPTADPADPDGVTAPPVLLTAEEYYAARNSLLQTVATAARNGEDLESALKQFALGEYPPSATGGNTGPRNVIYPTISTLYLGQIRHLYAQFFQGGETGQDLRPIYAQDRFAQANLAIKLVPGWRTATLEDRQLFADTLWVSTRNALLHSLARLAQESRAVGDVALATTAQEMAEFINGRFNQDRQVVDNNAAFTAALTAFEQPMLNGVPAELWATLQQMPRSMQRYAMELQSAANLAAARPNLQPVGYQPVFVGWGGINWDPWILNAAEVVAPVWRTVIRVSGGGEEGFSNMDGLRAFMAGDINADIRMHQVGYGFWETTFDTAATILTLLPIGMGSRAAISGGAYLPVSLALARNQDLSAGRHLTIFAAAGATTATAMTAIDAAPIPHAYKGTLRLVVGLTVGIGTGLGMNKLLPAFQSPLVARTLALTKTQQTLLQTTEEIARLQAAGGNITALAAKQAKLVLAVNKLTREIDEIRTLGGTTLQTAEANLQAAQDSYTRLMAEASAAGKSPSARAAASKSPELLQARKTLTQAQKTAQEATDAAGAEWLRNGKRINPPEPGTTPTGTTSGSTSLTVLTNQSCFVAGTPLLTPVGCKPIDQFKPGDLILSRPEHEPHRKPEAKVVEQVFKRMAFTLELLVSGKRIETTGEHPFYVVNKGWRMASELVAGDILESHNNQRGIVETIRRTGHVVPVYNVRVADWHTYFVGWNDWDFSVWAHNAEYAVFTHPTKAGEFALAVKNADGTFVYVTENGTTNVRSFTTANLAETAVHSGGGVVITPAGTVVPGFPVQSTPIPAGLLPAPRMFTEVVAHRAGNRQVLSNGQRWNVPAGTANSAIPLIDAVGDQLQAAARSAAGRWNTTMLTANEQVAIALEISNGRHWLANLLRAQARGRWIEAQVRQQFPTLQWSGVGADVLDPATGIRYDVMSKTRSNLELHGRRMAGVLFRYIDF